jgi:hypothetical protein
VRLLLDTHIFLWWITDDYRLSQTMRSRIMQETAASISLEAKEVCLTFYNDQGFSKRQVSVGSYPSGKISIKDIPVETHRSLTIDLSRNE